MECWKAHKRAAGASKLVTGSFWFLPPNTTSFLSIFYYIDIVLYFVSINFHTNHVARPLWPYDSSKLLSFPFFRSARLRFRCVPWCLGRAGLRRHEGPATKHQWRGDSRSMEDLYGRHWKTFGPDYPVFQFQFLNLCPFPAHPSAHSPSERCFMCTLRQTKLDEAAACPFSTGGMGTQQPVTTVQDGPELLFLSSS